jgi:hypothetical protein
LLIKNILTVVNKIEAEINKKIKFITTTAYQGYGFVVFEKE